MKEDLRKLKDEAARASERGKHKKAGELYAKVALLATRERDPQWEHRAGESYRRAGATREALAHLGEAAAQYARFGFGLKAIAVCKTILEMDPEHHATQEMLASLYAKGTPVSASAITATPPAADADADDARAGGAAVRPPPPPSAVARSGAAVDPPAATRTPTLDALSARARPASSSSAREPLASRPQPPAPAADTADAAPFEEPPATVEEHATGFGFRFDDGEDADADPTNLVRAAPRAPATGGPLDSYRLNEFMPDSHASTDFPGTEVPLPADDEDLLAAAKPALPWLPLFSSLDEEHLRRLIERCTRLEVAAGGVIMQQGDTGDSLFVIVRGTVELSADVDGQRHDLGQLQDGSFFGELAVLTQSRRTQTAVAITDVELLSIDQALLGELVEGSPDVMRTLLTFFRDRLLQRLMTTSPLFQQFPPEEAEALAARFQFLELEPGALLLTEGQRSSGLFVILCGACDVFHHVDGAEEPIAVLGPGELCGATSLLHPTAEAVTVRARTQVWALAMPRAVFHEVIQTHPQVLIYVHETADRRRRRLAGTTDLY